LTSHSLRLSSNVKAIKNTSGKRRKKCYIKKNKKKKIKHEGIGEERRTGEKIREKRRICFNYFTARALLWFTIEKRKERKGPCFSISRNCSDTPL
jgi:hypothetical protein